MKNPSEAFAFIMLVLFSSSPGRVSLDLGVSGMKTTANLKNDTLVLSMVGGGNVKESVYCGSWQLEWPKTVKIVQNESMFPGYVGCFDEVVKLNSHRGYIYTSEDWREYSDSLFTRFSVVLCNDSDSYDVLIPNGKHEIGFKFVLPECEYYRTVVPPDSCESYWPDTVWSGVISGRIVLETNRGRMKILTR